MALIFIEKVNASYSAAFEKKVREIATWLNVQPEWLMMVMYAESKLNPQAQNKDKATGRLIAAGLIQWTSASGLVGAPASALNLSALQQLDKVKEYFTPFRGKMFSYYDVYAVVFFPAVINKPDTYVLQTKKFSAALIAKQNPAVNINKDSQITVAEFKQYVYNSVPSFVRTKVFKAAATGLASVAVFFFSLI